jgi:hypothetical protein
LEVSKDPDVNGFCKVRDVLCVTVREGDIKVTLTWKPWILPYLVWTALVLASSVRMSPEAGIQSTDTTDREHVKHLLQL